MEYLQFANTTVYKMVAQEYDKTYDTDTKKQYGEGLKALYWAVQADSNTGELVAETTEVMLEYENGKFAYTSRCAVVEAAMVKAFEVMLNSMEVF